MLWQARGHMRPLPVLLLGEGQIKSCPPPQNIQTPPFDPVFPASAFQWCQAHALNVGRSSGQLPSCRWAAGHCFGVSILSTPSAGPLKCYRDKKKMEVIVYSPAVRNTSGTVCSRILHCKNCVLACFSDL